MLIISLTHTTAIAADAVTGAQIADNAVNSEHYTDGSIDREHLAADIVDGTKIADNAINSEHYAADSTPYFTATFNSAVDPTAQFEVSVQHAIKSSPSCSRFCVIMQHIFLSM